MQRMRLVCQYQEGGLEGIFGVLGVAGHLPTHTEHQRTVPPHERGKGILGVMRSKDTQ